MKTEKIILTDLLEIYEKRNLNNSNFKTKVKINLNTKEYPKYFKDRDNFDLSIDYLVNKEFIKTEKLKNENIIKYIYLNLEKVDEIYNYLGLENKINNLRNDLLNELNKYDDLFIQDLKNDILDKINNNKSIKKYLNQNIIDSIKAIHYIENLKESYYIRNLSNLIYNDSKKLEELESTINSIYQNENIFLEKGIIKTSPYLLIKGKGSVLINDFEISLDKINVPIQIPIDNLDIIKFNNIERIVTIENLTTFYDYQDEAFIIYLGGFPTNSQILCLKKLKEETTNFYHFGDIDYGGFTILNNLIDNLDIDIKTIHMDLNTIINNKEFVSEITDKTYIEKLKTLLLKKNLSNYYEVIDYLIKNNVKLEQESMYNNISLKKNYKF